MKSSSPDAHAPETESDNLVEVLERILSHAKTSLPSQVTLRQDIASSRLTSSYVLRKLASDRAHSVRRRVAANPFTPAPALAVLSQDPNLEVRIAAAGNYSTPLDCLEALSTDSDPSVRAAVALHASLPSQMLAELARDSNPEVAKAALLNPAADDALRADSGLVFAFRCQVLLESGDHWGCRPSINPQAASLARDLDAIDSGGALEWAVLQDSGLVFYDDKLSISDPNFEGDQIQFAGFSAPRWWLEPDMITILLRQGQGKNLARFGSGSVLPGWHLEAQRWNLLRGLLQWVLDPRSDGKALGLVATAILDQGLLTMKLNDPDVERFISLIGTALSRHPRLPHATQARMSLAPDVSPPRGIGFIESDGDPMPDLAEPEDHEDASAEGSLGEMVIEERWWLTITAAAWTVEEFTRMVGDDPDGELLAAIETKTTILDTYPERQFGGHSEKQSTDLLGEYLFEELIDHKPQLSWTSGDYVDSYELLGWE